MNHKRSITAIIVILVAMILLGVSNNRIEEEPRIYGYSLLAPVLKKEIKYASMELGKDYVGGYYVKYNDKVTQLFDKFAVPFIYRDYVRAICEIQNVDPLIFISLVQIESHWGTSVNGVTSDYNNKVEYRMYGNNKQWADLGLGQLSSRYAGEFEERYFNPALIRSLGYVREEFNIRDPWVNLQVSCSYVGFLYKYFGDYELAIQSYNTGLGNVIKGKIPKITKAYSHAILNSWRYRERDI